MNTSKEITEAVIDIVSTKQDWKAIVIAIAKSYPEVLLSNVKDIVPTYKGVVIKAVQHAVDTSKVTHCSGKVTAIQEVRSQTSLGLIEAKDLVEELVTHGLLRLREA